MLRNRVVALLPQPVCGCHCITADAAFMQQQLTLTSSKQRDAQAPPMTCVKIWGNSTPAAMAGQGCTRSCCARCKLVARLLRRAKAHAAWLAAKAQGCAASCTQSERQWTALCPQQLQQSSCSVPEACSQAVSPAVELSASCGAKPGVHVQSKAPVVPPGQPLAQGLACAVGYQQCCTGSC